MTLSSKSFAPAAPAASADAPAAPRPRAPLSERAAQQLAQPAARPLPAAADPLHAAEAAARARHRLHQAPPEPATPLPSRDSYARFIPREELKGFAAWTPGSFGGGSRPPSGVSAPVPPPPAPPSAAEIEAAQQAARSAARQDGYADGYRDGLVALEGFKQSYAQQLTGQIGALVASFGGQLQSLEAALAEEVAAIAVALARQVVRDSLATRPETVVAVAQEALAATLASARQIVLRLHPEDLALVARHAGEALAARGARLQADPAVRRGGCLVDSELGAIDATVESRWQRAVAGLGRESRWDGDAAAPAVPAEQPD